MAAHSEKQAVPSKTQRKRSLRVVDPVAIQKKKYILDTNVLLHDTRAIFCFEEHDIVLPMVVLEELDKHKKGVDDVARNARQVTRTLDSLLHNGSMLEGFPLTEASDGQATGRLYLVESKFSAEEVAVSLEPNKPDNQILATVMKLHQQKECAVLVTKDINLRVKAMAYDIPVQDYRNDKVFSDEDMLPLGYQTVDAAFWLEHSDSTRPKVDDEGWQTTTVNIGLPVNSFLEDVVSPRRTRVWRVTSSSRNTSELKLLRNQTRTPHRPLIEPRNIHQAMAMDLLMDENVDAVSLLGKAGSGKTLLAIAAGLEQVVMGRFQQVILTRAPIPFGEDIGFLPGTEQEKMGPWLGGTLEDVFMALGIDEKSVLREKVKIAATTFMRGRSFHNQFIIIDEAQNLSQGQTRGLLTRAGDGSKVVLTGNIAQLDTPYLDAGSCGLAWAVKHLEHWEHSGHLILPESVRSRLAAYIEDKVEAA